jgi:glycosyltransferase involved in cell wall biosynthesis
MEQIVKSDKMRIHIIGCARNASTTNIPADPFATVSYYLTTYLHRNNHEVHYYGYKESEVECKQKWECGDFSFLDKHYVTDITSDHFQDDHDANLIFFNNAKLHLLNNCKDNDIIICMWSPSISVISSTINKNFKGVKIIDGHIGHRLPNADTSYHVWTSNANRHFNYGMQASNENYWHDATIAPIASSLTTFDCVDYKSDYFLFMGRLDECKGLSIFLQLAKHFSTRKFILAGQGRISTEYSIPQNVTFVGLLNSEKRKEYLANAIAVISPTYYVEPFGLTAIEAGLSGTPIISTDHGGYTETVVNGYNGFRCSYFNDFVNAINNIDKIKSKDCRTFAEKFTAESLINEWETYLHRINRDTWYSLD